MKVSTSQQGNDIHFFRQTQEVSQMILLKANSVIQSRKVVFVWVWFFLKMYFS